MGSFWGRCGAGPRGRGRTGFFHPPIFLVVFFFFGDVFLFCVPGLSAERCQPHSTPPLPRSLIGSGIILFKSTLLWVASGGGMGQGARGKEQGARGKGQGEGLFCFFFVLGSWSPQTLLHLLLLLPRPPLLLPQPHPHQSALLGPSPVAKLSLCRIFPEGLHSSVGLHWAVVASLASGVFFGRVRVSWCSFVFPSPHGCCS